ncbi:MAG: hypothetical protein WA152_04410 [Microgenomates group bacterium]
MKSFIKHISHYFSLMTIFIAGVVGFYVFSYDQSFQIAVVIAMSLSYVSWGVIHHAIHKDLCLSIVLEYAAIALLGSVLILSLIFRS